ncbi:MAG: Uma2 family endonuclease [Cyanobacteria bacterium K_Offshore_surface_m2_239]|nr:Uma2 family endonuclease [Cyanobacteria bacterium K_Offshore_surface_m2_239]
MTLAPPASAAPPAPATGLVPLLLPPDLMLTPEQFALVCEANPEAVLELTATGQVIAMTPTGGDTSARNNLLSTRLQLWALGQGGWKVFDSSGGFRLPDGSVFSPDAAMVRLERWQALTPEERRGFPPLCPDLVVELVSPSDEGPRGSEALRRKMAAYLANGAKLGWLLFPEQRAVEIWQPGVDPEAPAVMERIESADGLEGGAWLPGLRLELAELWEG